MLLPDCTLFPHGGLPLHIFEPRYRQMLDDALEDSCFFAVAPASGRGKRAARGLHGTDRHRRPDPRITGSGGRHLQPVASRRHPGPLHRVALRGNLSESQDRSDSPRSSNPNRSPTPLLKPCAKLPKTRPPICPKRPARPFWMSPTRLMIPRFSPTSSASSSSTNPMIASRCSRWSRWPSGLPGSAGSLPVDHRV